MASEGTKDWTAPDVPQSILESVLNGSYQPPPSVVGNPFSPGQANFLTNHTYNGQPKDINNSNVSANVPLDYTTVKNGSGYPYDPFATNFLDVQVKTEEPGTGTLEEPQPVAGTSKEAGGNTHKRARGESVKLTRKEPEPTPEKTVSLASVMVFDDTHIAELKAILCDFKRVLFVLFDAHAIIGKNSTYVAAVPAVAGSSDGDRNAHRRLAKIRHQNDRLAGAYLTLHNAVVSTCDCFNLDKGPYTLDATMKIEA